MKDTDRSTDAPPGDASDVWDQQWVGGFSLTDARLRAGDVVGKSRVEKEIGHGGMGTVYLARHTTLDVEVALKILPPIVARDTPDLAKRFIREAQLAARIRHPNVVSVMDADFDESSGLYYIVLEYISGGSLADRLDKGPLAELDALKIILDIAQALVVAAEHGIVHRDIKPDNIMIDGQGHAKLADLGLAKQDLGGDTRVTKEGTSVGTPAYMSPDQVRDSSKADAQDDIYSLGATLYEALTGQPPFHRTNTYNVVSDVLYTPTPDPRDKFPAINKGLAAICMKMMAKKKRNRYASALELVWDLKQVQLGGDDLAAAPFAEGPEDMRATTEIRNDRLPSRPSLITPRSRVNEMVFALAVILVTAGLVGVYFFYFPDEPDAPAVRAATPSAGLTAGPMPEPAPPERPEPEENTASSIPQPPPTPDLDTLLAPAAKPVQPLPEAPKPKPQPKPEPAPVASPIPDAVAVAVPAQTGAQTAPAAIAVGRPVPPVAPAAQPIHRTTAFQAAHLAAQAWSPEVARSILKIQGDQTPAALEPIVWRILYFDPTASQNVRALVVSDGVITSQTEGFVEWKKLRLLPYKPEEIVPFDQLQVDSDRALEALKTDPDLVNVTLTSASFSLEKSKGAVPPVWKVSLYAQKGAEEVYIGEASVSAETGSVFEKKLSLGRLRD